jgi:superkiller protein 3
VEEEPVISEKPEVVYGNPAVFYKKGKKQFDLHHYQSSFNFLRQALEIDPTYAQAYFGLGYLYARFDMNDAAVRMYEMALRFDPNHIDAMNNLGMMYFHAGNYDDAVELFQKAIAMGDSADSEYNLGSVYLEKSQYDSAMQAFQRAVSLRPNDAAIYNNMALTDEKLGKKQDAIDSWNKVLQYSDNADLLQQAKTHLDFLQAQS